MAFTQESFRVRKDDGSETTATWYAATDTNCYVPLDTVFRVRLVISSNAAASDKVFYYDYRINGGEWLELSSSSDCFQSSSINVTHGADCTQQISSGTFEANNNGVSNNPALGGAVTGGTGNTFSAGEKEEVELVLELDSATLSNGDEVEIRVWDITTYTKTPKITVGTDPVTVTVNALFFGGD